MDTSALAKFADDKKPKRIPWEPLTKSDLMFGRVLSFDQSLASTGWVFLEHLQVIGCGTLKSAEPLRGGTAVLKRAALLEEELQEVRDRCPQHHPFTVVHEATPASSRLSRPESSLLAAREVQRAFKGQEVVVVAAQHAKKIVTGDANASKNHVKTALDALGFIHQYEFIRNEHQRDALANALTFLHDRLRGLA